MQKTAAIRELSHVGVVERETVKSPQTRVRTESNQDESDPLNIFVQIESMRSLEDGWLDGEGKAPPHESLEWFARTFDNHWVEPLPLPCIYPTFEGGIQAEWMIGRCAISLEVEFPSKKAYYHHIHLDTKEDFEADLDLSNSECWKTLKKTLLWVIEEASE